MLLSDEDRVEPSAMTNLLDFLDNCPESISVISCSIFDAENGRYFCRRSDRLCQVDLDLDAVASLQIIPTYLSGLTFAAAKLGRINLNSLCQNSLGNAYPHLNISNYLLVDGYLRIFQPYFVVMGKAIGNGGDGHSHRQTHCSRNEGNLDLNPLDYGPKARTRQFFYMENVLSNFKKSMSWSAYALSKIYLFIFFSYGVINSDKVTVIEHNVLIRTEVEVGLREAQMEDEFSGSWLAKLYYLVARMPLPFGKMVLKIIKITFSFLHRLMTIFVLFRSRQYDQS